VAITGLASSLTRHDQRLRDRMRNRVFELDVEVISTLASPAAGAGLPALENDSAPAVRCKPLFGCRRA